MEFIFYDILLLIAFAITVSVFLYTRKKNLKKEGLLLLYKTSWGIKLINYLGKRNKRLLKILSWISIILGYVLMITMVYFFIRILWVYIFNPDIVRAVKIPPIMPLIPYLPKLFNLTFLPPFYFIYWIIIIAIIAIPHELFHGIFSAFNKIKIKNTGFGFFPYFFPVFLAAFVEPDEEKMQKESNFNQMAILSAGTFANVLTAIFFFFIMWGFFSAAFTPIGVTFDSYSNSLVNISEATAFTVNNVVVNVTSHENLLNLMEENKLNEINIDGKSFYTAKSVFASSSHKQLFEERGLLFIYDNSPAIQAGLMGAISEIKGVGIDSVKKLSEELAKTKPGENILVKAFDGENHIEYNITLGQHPEQDKGWLGIGFIDRTRSGFSGRIVNFLSSFKDPNVYYESSAFGEFIYNLLWWIVLISFSVALVNMLPIGIFDGGRFFYLTVLSITKSENISKKAFSYLTFFFLFLLVLIMVFWAKSFI